VVVPSGQGTVLQRLNIQPIELVVGEVSQEVLVNEGSRQTEAGPAFMAGIRKGDRLISIDGKALTTWEDVPELVKAAAGREFEIVWSRNGEILRATIRSKATILQDSMMGKDNPLTVNVTPRIGVSPYLSAEASHVIEQSWNPSVWLKKGVNETWELISLTAQALGKLVTGQLSLRTLGSPIMIFKVAGNSYRVAGGGQFGWVAFLKTLALLSVSLGLVNLFPIPVLDGGHATFFVLEWIRGRPVSLRTMEIASQVGMVLLLSLFGLVIYNDFVRYHFFDKIFGLFQ
jgi:regulator of sigma E protease